MGGQKAHNDHHAQHHDQHHGQHHGQHHDQHHDQHHEVSRFDPPKGSPLDFTKKHPVFNIQLQKIGPQFGQIHERRQEFIRQKAGKYQVPEPFVPLNIQGLIPKRGPLPSNRKFWSRPSSSFERNGMFNIHTHNFNTRLMYPLFFFMVLYGWWGHSTYGMYKARYDCNDELPQNMYDKLNTRVPPVSKLWLRPG